MAETYKEMLKRAEKKGEGQTNAPAKSAVASVALPKGGSAEGYINAIYDASKNARNAQLEAAYNKAESDIALARAKADASYAEAQRQTAGEAARQGANFREIANANGLNTGAGGQAALAMSNQAQNDIASLNRAKAQDMSEIERQKAMLAQNFEQKRQQLIAENDYNRNSALYSEYVRSDENRRQQEQFDTQMNMQMLQMAMAERQRQLKKAEKAKKGAGGYVEEAYEPIVESYDDAVLLLDENGITTRPMSKERFAQQMTSGSRLPDDLNLYRVFGYDYENDPDDYYGLYLSDFVGSKIS